MTNLEGRCAVPIELTPEFLKKLELLSILSKKVFTGRIRGEKRSKKRGASVEFADFRDYSIGDDFRYLDWNAYGRLGKLFLKLFVEEEDLFVYLIVDASASMDHGEPNKFHYAKTAALALAYVALSNMDSVSIGFSSSGKASVSPTVRGRAKIFSILKDLNGKATEGKADLGKAAELLVASKRRRGVVFLLSDMYDLDGSRRGIDLLKYSGFEPVVLHVLSSGEISPEVKGSLRLVDCESADRVEVTVSGRLMALYRKHLDGFCHECESFCGKREVPYLRVVTDTPIEELVLKYFRNVWLT